MKKTTTKLEYPATRRTGKTLRLKDLCYSALPAGMRKTDHGTWYYEGRRNRSDVNAKRKL